jgi:hypothetical protein
MWEPYNGVGRKENKRGVEGVELLVVTETHDQKVLEVLFRLKDHIRKGIYSKI